MSTPAATAPAMSSYHGLFVDGVWRATESAVPVLNPATEQTVVDAPWGTAVDAGAAVSAARRAFDGGPWPRMTPAQRSGALARLRDVLAGWTDDIVGLVVAEAGIPVSVARPSQFDAPMRLFEFFIDRCATFEALRRHFSEREIVEITWVNAVENYYNLINLPLGIESDGFCSLVQARAAQAP